MIAKNNLLLASAVLLSNNANNVLRQPFNYHDIEKR